MTTSLWTLCCLLGTTDALLTGTRNHSWPNVSEVLPEEHELSYPYVVGVKKYEKGGRRPVIRCTGTMLAQNLVLTTKYCVENPTRITVFKLQNPKDMKSNRKGVNVVLKDPKNLEKQELQEGERKPFPNPLMYGIYLKSDFKWNGQLNKAYNDKHHYIPKRNLAIIHLESPLYKDRNITYPVIVNDPGKFATKVKQNEKAKDMEKDKVNPVVLKASVYGWCQDGNKSADPSLTKSTIDVQTCEIDSALFYHLCMNKTHHKDMICSMDEGGPVILIEAENKGEEQAAPNLLALVNTVSSDGILTYLWPYVDWIQTVMELHASTPLPPLPCAMTNFSDTTTDDPHANNYIESYYEYNEVDTGNGHKMFAKCGAPPPPATAVRSLRFAIAHAGATYVAAPLFARALNIITIV